jgi:hypothetical protein
MSDNSTDPGGSTEQFQAFMHDPSHQEEPKRTSLPLVVGLAVGVLALLIIVVTFVM